jgi:hypothetical protein
VLENKIQLPRIPILLSFPITYIPQKEKEKTIFLPFSGNGKGEVFNKKNIYV